MQLSSSTLTRTLGTDGVAPTSLQILPISSAAARVRNRPECGQAALPWVQGYHTRKKQNYPNSNSNVTSCNSLVHPSISWTPSNLSTTLHATWASLSHRNDEPERSGRHPYCTPKPEASETHWQCCQMSSCQLIRLNPPKSATVACHMP